MFVNHWRSVGKLFAFITAVVLVLGLAGCDDRSVAVGTSGNATKLSSRVSEVSPPEVIQELRQMLEVYQPQVTIATPKPNEVLQDDRVSVQFQVQDLPIFKDADLGLGPHLHVVLDNEPYKAVYDVSQPFVFSDVAPGTHTLRVFASRPWHESFKNEGAYAQTTFHVFTKTQDNQPDAALPLLTYSRPVGTYGAEPVMLDFYLTNAPLHLVAEKSGDEIPDWRIRCTVNGESFVVDRWQPLYLKGFKLGKNWVQIEFLDEQGNSVKNVFNNTVRLINYESKGKDTLSKLVRGELTIAQARGIVDPTYRPEVAAPSPSLSPLANPTLTPSPTPLVQKTPKPEPVTTVEPAPPLEPIEAQEVTPTLAPVPSLTGKTETMPAPVLEEMPKEASEEPAEVVQPTPREKKLGRRSGRFRRPTLSPEVASPLPSSLPEILEEPSSVPESSVLVDPKPVTSGVRENNP